MNRATEKRIWLEIYECAQTVLAKHADGKLHAPYNWTWRQYDQNLRKKLGLMKSIIDMIFEED